MKIRNSETYMEYNQDTQIMTSKSRQPDWLKNQVNNIFLDNFDYPENAADEEQEDLPYDGGLEGTYQHTNESDNLKASTTVENISASFLNLTCSEINRSVKEVVNYETQQLPQEKVFQHHTPATRTNGITIEMATEAPVSGMSFERELSGGAFNSPVRKEHFTNSKISDVLLRHFSKEELLNTSQLIDCETIPDTSFTESVDEIVLTKTRTSECINATLRTEQWPKHFEDYHLNRQEETHEHDYNDKCLLDENKSVINVSATSHGNGEDCIQEYSLLITANKDKNNFQNTTKKHLDQKGFFRRTGSSHELKYGQGQVNYGLPDFSKVAPKVKIPKRDNNDKSGPILKRTKLLPKLVGKSAVVKDLLETMSCFDSAEVKNQEEEMKIPQLKQQQLELLTKQAEAQNHIDHLRFEPKIYSHSESSNPNFPMHSRHMGAASEKYTFHPLNVPLQPMFGLSQTSYSGVQSERMTSSLPSASAAGEIHCLNPYKSLENKKKGEEMSQVLKEQAEQLKTKVEEFSKHVTQEAFPLQDRYLMLKELQGHLDTLERNYLATKEEHHDLQLQNCNHKSINIGEFDPDRKVEGEIFSLGMLLEDVKEKIDDNICSPCPSLFTTSPTSSLTPYESECSSCSLLPESPTVSSICDPLGRRASKMNFFNKEGNEGENRSIAIDAIPKQSSQLFLPDDNFDLFPEVQLGLQKRDVSSCVKGMEPLEKAGLPANKPPSAVMQCFHLPVADDGIRDTESHRQLTLSQKANTDQENPNGTLNFWQMKSSRRSKPYNMCNLKHKIIHPNMQQEQVYLADHCFCGRTENCSNEYDASLHPKRKIHWSKKANKELGSCSFKRNKKTEDRKSDGEKSKCDMYSVFIQKKEVELDLSGSDSEDILFCDSFTDTHSGEFLKHRTDNYRSCRAGLKEQSKVSSQEKRIASNSVCISKQPVQILYRLSGKCKGQIPKTCYSRMHDKITFLPQYLARRKVYGSKSMINIRNNETDTKLLNSSLDHAIQIATSLKETTERMVQVVAEDLAKVKTHRNYR